MPARRGMGSLVELIIVSDYFARPCRSENGGSATPTPRRQGRHFNDSSQPEIDGLAPWFCEYPFDSNKDFSNYPLN